MEDKSIYENLALENLYMPGVFLPELKKIEFEKFEKKFNIKLPEDYIRFLLHRNGGTVPNSVDARYVTSSGVIKIKDFYSFKFSHKLALLPGAWLDYHVCLPKYIFPFCTIDDSNEELVTCVFVSCFPFSQSGIYVLKYSFDLGSDCLYDDFVASCHVIKIANSFTEFVKGLSS